jgi:polysaccharide pyruvyl transferase WcaK-like protein
MYMHSGSANHGCEAIVRTTAELLGGPEDVVLWSLAKQEDELFGAASQVERIIVSEELPRFSPAYFKALLRRKVLHQADANLMVFLKTLFKGNIAISVGGDNYCYPWSANQAVTLNREIRKHAKATVLWGCSIDPEAITPEVREDLAKYDLITAREPITYELLKAINPNTIRVADPAFTLDRVDLPVPDGFIEGNTVGVNVSPLIMKYGTEGSLILANYENMIRSILEMTDMQVCLIPHVVWEHNDDREPCRVLYEKFRDTGRVCMVEGGNATQLKGYIARCRFFVGARTHATIAAYSTCVPTLVVGYSVKSRGIARDLFGTEENYVLPVQNLKNENHLADAFRWLVKQEAPIRQTLKNVIPGYIDMAKIGAAALKKLQ